MIVILLLISVIVRVHLTIGAGGVVKAAQSGTRSHFLVGVVIRIAEGLRMMSARLELTGRTGVGVIVLSSRVVFGRRVLLRL